MKRTVTIVIKQCNQCPHFAIHEWDRGDMKVCTITSEKDGSAKMISYSILIPDWCPLLPENKD